MAANIARHQHWNVATCKLSGETPAEARLRFGAFIFVQPERVKAVVASTYIVTPLSIHSTISHSSARRAEAPLCGVT